MTTHAPKIDTPQWIPAPDGCPSDKLIKAPAPWKLTGNAYISLMHFSKQFRRDQCFTVDSLKGKEKGFFSLLAYIDYHSSNVGPYKELMFIPGQFHVSNRKYWSIGRIFVSSWESVANGQENWGIPKDCAEFTSVIAPDGTEIVQISKQGQTFAELTYKAYGPAIPANSAWLPKAMRTLVQHYQHQTFTYRPETKGKAQFARIIDRRSDGQYFPDLSQGRVLLTTRLENFTLDFPIAHIWADQN